MSKLCYPHAYGNLDARASNLVEKFAIDCHWCGVEASEEQLSILKKLVDEMRDEAYEQALEHDEQGGCEAPRDINMVTDRHKEEFIKVAGPHLDAEDHWPLFINTWYAAAAVDAGVKGDSEEWHSLCCTYYQDELAGSFGNIQISPSKEP